MIWHYLGKKAWNLVNYKNLHDETIKRLNNTILYLSKETTKNYLKTFLKFALKTSKFYLKWNKYLNEKRRDLSKFIYLGSSIACGIKLIFVVMMLWNKKAI